MLRGVEGARLVARRERIELIYDALRLLARSQRGIRRTRLMQLLGLNVRSFARVLDPLVGGDMWPIGRTGA